ncbi:MAG: GTPase ObgE [Parachlamydiales bacterium]|nr:GTPase ObgE [Parachlamydiales bacterium]
MFIDHVTISFSGGKGGNGIVAWRREKYIPKGGPAGGNGGPGGSIILQGDRHLFSLEHLRNRPHINADNGHQGGPNNRTGKRGSDKIIKVPLGTLIKDASSQKVIIDLTRDQEQYILCHGGRGGRGNTSFKSSTHQAPHICTEGTPGEKASVELELKIIADVGLIGMPNAGKSTLLKALTSIPVKIAPYPFTTLTPNIGIMEFPDFSRIIIADIPGIIEKAHEDKGLGLTFLRHIERTSALVFVIDGSNPKPFEDLEILQKELAAYNMKEKPFLVVFNKIDTKIAQENFSSFQKKYPFLLENLFAISALEKEGLVPFITTLQNLSQKERKKF